MSISVIGKDGVTPESVLGIALENADELEGVVIIGFTKDKHNYLSCACSLSDLTIGQAMLLEHWIEIRSGKTPARMGE